MKKMPPGKNSPKNKHDFNSLNPTGTKVQLALLLNEYSTQRGFDYSQATKSSLLGCIMTRHTEFLLVLDGFILVQPEQAALPPSMFHPKFLKMES